MPAKTGLIQWQLPMKRVLLALAPIELLSVYLFGWRALVLLLVCNAAAFATEYAFCRGWKQPVSSAVFVSGCLFALSLPPGLPLWIAGVGIGFGILFGKMVFGGFGRNVFNPALTGRAFIYVCFGAQMTGQWPDPVRGSLLGGFAAYQSDAITAATPGMLLKTAGAGTPIGLWEEFVGTTSGTLGGTSALLALLGGLYLVWTKAANYRIVVSGLAGYLLMQAALWLGQVRGAPDPLNGILTGSYMIGAFFYATDPVSAAQTNAGRWLYGALVGLLSSLISTLSAWPAGTMFAILLANTFAPLIDYTIRQAQGAKA